MFKKENVLTLLWLVIFGVLIWTMITNWEDVGLVLAWIAKFGF